MNPCLATKHVHQTELLTYRDPFSIAIWSFSVQ
jgi:hypothetical protein